MDDTEEDPSGLECEFLFVTGFFDLDICSSSYIFMVVVLKRKQVFKGFVGRSVAWADIYCKVALIPVVAHREPLVHHFTGLYYLLDPVGCPYLTNGRPV